MKTSITFLLSTLQICLVIGHPDGGVVAPANNVQEEQIKEDVLSEVKNAANVVNESIVKAFDEIEDNADVMLKNAENDLKGWQTNPALMEKKEATRAKIISAHDNLIEMCESVRQNLINAASDMNDVQSVEKYKMQLLDLQQHITNYIKPAADELQSETDMINKMTKSIPSASTFLSTN